MQHAPIAAHTLYLKFYTGSSAFEGLMVWKCEGFSTMVPLTGNKKQEVSGGLVAKSLHLSI